MDYVTRNNFTLKFIPARSPYVGGLWESAVKSCKAPLIKAAGQQVLTFEQLNTVVTNVEAILSSRPLCSDPSTDLGYLSAGHFLVGSALMNLPATDTLCTSLTKRFRVQRQIIATPFGLLGRKITFINFNFTWNGRTIHLTSKSETL